MILIKCSPVEAVTKEFRNFDLKKNAEYTVDRQGKKQCWER